MSQPRRAFARIPSRVLRLLALVGALSLALALPAAALASEFVFIDPGHGGPYNHVNAFGLREKHVNLWLGLELRKQLVAEGFSVGMTRETDRALTTRDTNTWHWDSRRGIYRFYKDGRVMGDPPPDDLQMRCNAANNAGADVFISIHNNASANGGARGTETWAAQDDALGRSLGRYVQQAVVQQTGLKNRGAKVVDFYVVKWTNMPAVLIEGGFMTNRWDAKLLSSPAFRAKIARGIVLGLERWLATDPFKRLYPRYGGQSTADVAAAASLAAFPGGSDSVVLVSSEDATSAMTVPALARKLGAPVLVASASGVPTATAAELARLHPAHVVAVAPATALPSTVLAEAVADAGAQADSRRIAGADVYETAALVASEVGVPADGRVAIASGESFPDALTASCVSNGPPVPVLLTPPGPLLAPATLAFLASHATEVTRTIVVGPATSVWPQAVATLPRVTRLSGLDRYLTNVAVLRAMWPAAAISPLVTRFEPSASGVVAASAAARTGQPLLITGGRMVSSYSREWIQNVHGRVRGWTLVGTDTEMPALADQILAKAAN
jgi:N-acetylmuramoyl-L-alanine amidase/putative cell wall-binding protein